MSEVIYPDVNKMLESVNVQIYKDNDGLPPDCCNNDDSYLIFYFDQRSGERDIDFRLCKEHAIQLQTLLNEHLK